MPGTQRNLYSTGWRWGFASGQTQILFFLRRDNHKFYVLRFFRYQHVGILALGDAKVLSFALGDVKLPDASSFAFWWNIGLSSCQFRFFIFIFFYSGIMTVTVSKPRLHVALCRRSSGVIIPSIDLKTTTPIHHYKEIGLLHAWVVLEQTQELLHTLFLRNIVKLDIT